MPSPTPGSRHSNDRISQSRPSRHIEIMAQPAGIPQRLRSDGMVSREVATVLTSLESWVEISSQPSSSSLSSIGDEIVTTGLRVQHDSNARRRRRVASPPARINLEPRQTETSSQEEYEESESEEDRVMTFSKERISPPLRLMMSRPEYDVGSDSDDDDENATALGRRTNPSENVFTPQPNAFSHPPCHRTQSGSYFPQQRGARNERPSYISRNTSRQSHTADHDAALRASLTTLLSIGAAAARGLPKREQGGIGNTAMPSTEPIGLRLVPESELNNPTSPVNPGRPLTPSTKARSSPSVCSQDAIEQGKRKAASTKPAGEKTRAVKKKRMQALEEETTMISPTLMAWVVSAGVVVLVSVVGFGAGYVIGREVGRGEALAGFNGSSLADSGICGREAVRGGALRRFKWGLGGAAKGIIA